MVPEKHAKILKPDELARLIAGEQRIDVANLRANMSVDGTNPEDPIIEWLLAEIDAMTDAEQVNLMQFWSGVAAIPVVGFAPQPDAAPWSVRIVVDAPISHLPSAATCSYLLKLPAYPTRAELAAKLRLAVSHGAMGYSNQ